MRLEELFREELPRLNRAVLTGGASPASLSERLAAVLPGLPSPAAVSAQDAQRLVIGLGLAGSSVARHFQEHDLRRKQCPERAFDGLYAGPELIPFQKYFAGIAERTGTGHYQRDTYASLVIWNVPTTEVRLEGHSLAKLPGIGDEPVLTYTGDVSEQWFFESVKCGQTLELGANTLLEPLADGDIDLASAEGLRRVQLATTLLEALRRLFVEIADVQAGKGMQPAYFMDVFRQFAAHWAVGDIPPSGALDVDALKRDFLLGTVDDHYVRHVERLMPALLADEREGLRRRMDEPALPARLLTALGLDGVALAQLRPDQLDALATTYPALTTWYTLLSSHARAAGAHLMVSKRFLFNPQRRREDEGKGDQALVSNRRGTTGMDESVLGRLARLRHDHQLMDLRRASDAATRSTVNLPVDSVEVLPSAASRAGWPRVAEPTVRPRAGREHVGMRGPRDG
jgi:hypothetical protein